MSIFHQLAILSSHKRECHGEGDVTVSGTRSGAVFSRQNVASILSPLRDEQRHGGDGIVPDGLFMRPLCRDVMCRIKDVVRVLHARHKHIVIFGAGASLSCGHIYSAWASPLYGGIVGRFASCETILCDSIDPMSLRCLMEEGGEDKRASTCFIFISRSGETLETVEQWRYVEARLRSMGVSLPQHCMMVLGVRDSTLGREAMALGVDVECFDERVSGRFSPLREVGVMIGLLVHVDMESVCRAGLEHARWAVDGEGREVLIDHVLWHDMHRRQGRPISVFMGSGDRRYGVGRWYRQLWAESLGKEGQGLTPFEATGPRDQHSQLQLWLEGGDDKTYTLVGQQEDKTRHALCALQQDCRLGTQEALLSCRRPVRVITYSSWKEDVLGALIAQCMLETYALCRLWGIDPFDQPAVAMGKLHTKTRFHKRDIAR